MMKISNELPNSTTWSTLGSRALYLISTLPEEERTKEHVTDKGESKSPDEMTVRELQELKIQLKQQSDLHDRQLKEKDDVINKTYEQLKNAQNQKKEVVRETVEVVPDDYEQIKNSLNQLKSRNDHLEAEHQELIEKQQEVSEKSTKFDQLNEAIQQSQGRLNQTQKKISEYNNLHNLLKQSNEFLTKASTLIYSDISELVQSDELAKKEMTYLQNKLDRFNRDLNNILNQGLILEGEIIND